MHVIAAKAVCFGEALRPEFLWYQHQVVANAKALEETLRSYGMPMVTDGTDNHLLLLNTWDSVGLTGKQAEDALAEIGITANKNSLPNDLLAVSETSGIRIGTPALTTRGMKEKEMKEIVTIICEAFLRRADVLRDLKWQTGREHYKTQVRALLRAFPYLYAY